MDIFLRDLNKKPYTKIKRECEVFYEVEVRDVVTYNTLNLLFVSSG